MDFKEAVELAKAGEERGYGYLYANTYKSKLYLALKYMKDEELAEDVMQEAYVKAFNHLEQIREPEKFSAWFGKIVANTALNQLKKNKRNKEENTLFFSEFTDKNGESYEYDPEDEAIEFQPEMSYNQKETQELVHLLLDELPDEQRLSILMFHLEGASIQEIAETMNCSENTVKSRLNYGRKNLKIKAEEMKKKGYELYNVAPLPLLLMLLRSEEHAMEGALLAAGTRIESAVFDYGMFMQNSGGIVNSQPVQGQKEPWYSSSNETQNDAYNMESKMNQAQSMSGEMNSAQNPTGMSGGAKTGFLHTTAGKIATVAVVGVCILGGIVFYKNSQPEPVSYPFSNNESFQQENTKESESPEPSKEASIKETPFATPEVTLEPTPEPVKWTSKEVQWNIDGIEYDTTKWCVNDKAYFIFLNTLYICPADANNGDGKEAIMSWDKEEVEFLHIANAYENNLYICLVETVAGEASLYSLNIESGEQKKEVKMCNAVEGSGKYIYGNKAHVSDTGAYEFFVWEITDEGVKEVSKLGDHVFGTTVVDDKVYYAWYPSARQTDMTVFSCDLDGSHKKELFNLKTEEEYGQILINVDKASKTIAISGASSSYVYSISTGKLKKQN